MKVVLLYLRLAAMIMLTVTDVHAERYKLVEGNFTWHKAKEDAETHGGHLATITSQKEQRIIEQLLKETNNHLWLGGTDEEKEGNWRWITGETWDFTNWNTREPNGSNNENYLNIWGRNRSNDKKGRWNDYSNFSGDVEGYIMEIPKSQPQQPDIEKGLVAYYPFNGNAKDESGNGNDGEVSGATLVADRFGESQKAFKFEGKSSISAEGITLPDEYSFSVWFRSTASDARMLIKFTEPGTLENHAFLMHNVNSSHQVDNLRFNNRIPKGGSGGISVYSKNDLHGGNWHNAICIKNENNLFLYIDGIKDSETSDTNKRNNTLTDLLIGENFDNWHYDGLIDDIRIYNRALSEAEVAELYELEKPKPTYTLTVASRNPGSGAEVAVSPADNEGKSRGTTHFTLEYPKGIQVTLTAEQGVGGNWFNQWLKNGVPIGTGPTVTVTLDWNHTLRAVYEAESKVDPDLKLLVSRVLSNQDQITIQAVGELRKPFEMVELELSHDLIQWETQGLQLPINLPLSFPLSQDMQFIRVKRINE